MSRDTICSGLIQCAILHIVEILVAASSHASVMQNIAMPTVMVKFSAVRDENKCASSFAATHTALRTALERFGKLLIIDYHTDL